MITLSPLLKLTLNLTLFWRMVLCTLYIHLIVNCKSRGPSTVKLKVQTQFSSLIIEKLNYAENLASNNGGQKSTENRNGASHTHRAHSSSGASLSSSDSSRKPAAGEPSRLLLGLGTPYTLPLSSKPSPSH